MDLEGGSPAPEEGTHGFLSLLQLLLWRGNTPSPLVLYRSRSCGRSSLLRMGRITLQGMDGERKSRWHLLYMMKSWQRQQVWGQRS